MKHANKKFFSSPNQKDNSRVGSQHPKKKKKKVYNIQFNSHIVHSVLQKSVINYQLYMSKKASNKIKLESTTNNQE